MKKTLLVAALLVTMVAVYAQKPQNKKFKEYTWEQNITDVASYNAGNKTFLIFAKAYQGQILIQEVISNGQMGRRTTTKTMEKRGRMAIDVFSVKGNASGHSLQPANSHSPNNKLSPKGGNLTHYLFISYADYGNAAIYRLNNNGTIGEKTWETDRWEKGITEVATLDCGPKQYMFLMKPDAGWAWTFRLNNNGSVGSVAWSTKGWHKGIDGVSAFRHAQNGAHLLLTHTDGNAWIITADHHGKLDNHRWHTNSWEKGISTVTMGWKNFKHYFLLMKPSVGKAWTFNFGEQQKNPEYKWQTTNWEKGITNIHLFKNTNGEDLLFLNKPDSGTTWIYSVY